MMWVVMIQKILFPTDLGLYTSYLLEHVALMAQAYQAEIHILHTIENRGVFAASLANKDGVTTEQNAGNATLMAAVKQHILSSLEDDLFCAGNPGLSQISGVHVAIGNTVDTILDKSGELEVDLIIMGSHGQDALSNNILGSVTHKILQLASVPVFMVPLARKNQQQHSFAFDRAL